MTSSTVLGFLEELENSPCNSGQQPGANRVERHLGHGRILDHRHLEHGRTVAATISLVNE
jgi:hypothetical protein